MNTLINNKHLLDSNNYRNIVITEYNDAIKVNVSGQLMKYKGIKLSQTPFSKTITDNPVDDIISYFIRNNTIDEVLQENLSKYTGNYLIFNNGNRKLCLQLSDKYESSFNNLITKYNEDRVKFLYKNSDAKVLDLQLGYHSAYYDIRDNNGNKVLIFNMLEHNKELASFDLNFFNSFINDYILNSDKEIVNKGFNLNVNDMNYYGKMELNIGDLCILYPRELDTLIRPKLWEQYYRIKEDNIKQLRFDFKKER